MPDIEDNQNQMLLDNQFYSTTSCNFYLKSKTHSTTAKQHHRMALKWTVVLT